MQAAVEQLTRFSRTCKETDELIILLAKVLFFSPAAFSAFGASSAGFGMVPFTSVPCDTSIPQTYRHRTP